MQAGDGAALGAGAVRRQGARGRSPAGSSATTAWKGPERLPCAGENLARIGKKKKKARGGQLSAASTQGKVRGPIALRGIPASEHLQDETERSEEKAELPAHDFVISLTVLDADFKAPAVGVVG